MDRLFSREDPPDQDKETTPDLERIWVYGRDSQLAGWVTPPGERVTDILQRGADLPVLPDGADPADPDSWMALVASEVLIVVPPPHVSPPERRVHRQTQRVRLRIGPYSVIGTAHLRPGFEQDLFMRATQPYLPLTDAVINSEAGELNCDVAIVNLAEVEEMTEA